MNQRTNADRKSERLRQLVAHDHCALLIQEVQEGVVGPKSGFPALASAVAEVGMIDHVAQVAAIARTWGVPVIHCTAETLPGGFGSNHNARLFAAARKAGLENLDRSDLARPVPEVGPEGTDIVLPRYHGLSPMSGSPLDQLLRNTDVTTVVVVGVSLNVAIPNLVFDAVNRGYQVVVVSDAVAGTPVEYGSQVLENSLSLVATVVTSDELASAWNAAP